jgi:hypothetical protein
VVLCFLKTLVDFQKTNEYLQQIEANMTKDDLVLEKLALHSGGQMNAPYSDIITSLLEGKLLVVTHEDCHVLLDTVHVLTNRNVQTPLNENVIQSSFDAFTENIVTNIGVLRSKIVSPDLIIDSFSVGETNSRQIAVIFCKGKVNNTVIRDVLDRFKKNKEKDIRHVQDLCRLLGQKWWNIIPTMISTEMPLDTVDYLLEGRVVIFLDHYPFAIVIPSIVSDIWSIKADRNFPVLFMASIRFIRITGLLVAIISPGLYVALVTINPEALRIQLALAVSKSREGVPYPAIIETILLLLILEMIVEASVRLPKSIGPTITMVGGIILGEAVIQAKLVSNLLIITLAATTIANFTVSGVIHMLMIRLLKYVILVMSSVFGILGLIGGLEFIGCYMAAVTTFSIPYLTLKMKKG